MVLPRLPPSRPPSTETSAVEEPAAAGALVGDPTDVNEDERRRCSTSQAVSTVENADEVLRRSEGLLRRRRRAAGSAVSSLAVATSAVDGAAVGSGVGAVRLPRSERKKSMGISLAPRLDVAPLGRGSCALALALLAAPFR